MPRNRWSSLFVVLAMFGLLVGAVGGPAFAQINCSDPNRCTQLTLDGSLCEWDGVNFTPDIDILDVCEINPLCKSGFDFTRIVAHYDFATNRLFLGMDIQDAEGATCERDMPGPNIIGVPGDANGDNDTSFNKGPGICLSGDDQPCVGVDEAYTFQIDTNVNGSFTDVVDLRVVYRNDQVELLDGQRNPILLPNNDPWPVEVVLGMGAQVAGPQCPNASPCGDAFDIEMAIEMFDMLDSIPVCYAVKAIAQSLVDGPPEDFSDVDFSDNRPSPAVTIVKSVRNITMNVPFDDRGVPARPGDRVEFKMDVTNTGDIRLATGSVTDNLPVEYINIQETESACNVVGQQFQCTFTDLDVGQTVSFLVQATVDPNTMATKILNTSNVTATAVQEGAGCGGQTVMDNDPARVFLLDLMCEKLVSADGGQTYSPMVDAVPGQTLLFRVTVTNPSAADFDMVTMSDMLDANCFDTVMATSANCGETGNLIECSVSPLPAGGMAVFEYSARLRADVDPARMCMNTAMISGFFSDVEVTTECSAEVNPLEADVACTKLVSLDNVMFFPEVAAAACQTVYFEVTVSNTGESSLFDIQIDDTLPGEYTNVVIDAGSNASCNANGNNVSCTIAGPLASGNDVVVKYRAEFNGQVDGARVTNRANITATPGVGPTPEEQGAPVSTFCEADVITQVPNIVCETLVSLDNQTFVAGPIDVVPGQKVFFRATVTNTGSAPFHSTLFEDTLDTCFGNITIESGAGCNANGRTLSCDFGATLADGSHQVTYSAFTIAENTLCGNDASATGIPGTPDNEGCFVNSRCSTMVDILNVEIECLKLSSIDGVNFFPEVAAQPGDTVFFKVIISIPDGGEACFANVAMTDMLPPEFGNIQFISGAASCGTTGNMIMCTDLGAAPFCPGDNPIEVVYSADLSTGTLPEMLTNNVTVTGTPGIPGVSGGGTPEDTMCSSTVRILNLDIECEKLFEPAMVVDGQTVTFTVNVTNTSESDVTWESVTLDDTLSAGFTNIQIVSSPGNCNVNQGARTIQCDLGELAKDQTKTVIYTADVDNPNALPLSNNAMVTAMFGNIIKTSECPRNIPLLQPCIECVKEATLSPDNTGYMSSVDAIPGQRVYFRVRINNCGDAPFRRVSLEDMLPAGFSDLQIEQGPGCVITGGNTTISCDDLGPLAPNDPEIIVRFSGKVNENQPPGQLMNIASVTGFTGTDENPGNNETSNCPIPIDVLEIDFTCEKEVSIDGTNFFPSVTAVPGQRVYFRVKVDNTGEVPVELTLTDDIGGIYRNPTESETDCGFLGTTLECTFDLAAGASRTINYEAILRNTVDPGTYLNTVDLSVKTGPDNNPGAEREKFDECQAEVEVLDPSIVCRKGVSLEMTGPFETELSVVPGDHVFFQVIITNDGDTDLRNVNLRDIVSDSCFANLNLIEPLPPTCETNGFEINCDFGDLAPGEEIVVLYEADVIEGTSEVCRNTVEITANTGSEPNPGADVETECSAIVTTIVVEIPTLSEIGFMLLVMALGGMMLMHRRMRA